MKQIDRLLIAAERKQQAGALPSQAIAYDWGNRYELSYYYWDISTAKMEQATRVCPNKAAAEKDIQTMVEQYPCGDGWVVIMQDYSPPVNKLLPALVPSVGVVLSQPSV